MTNVVPAKKSPSTEPKAPAYEPGEILVRFKSGTGAAKAQRVHTSYHTQLIRTYRSPADLHLVKLPRRATVAEVVEQYRRDPNVLYAEPNYRYQLQNVTPNDPLFATLWGLHNIGQAAGTPDSDINAPEAWQITTGDANVVIGVLDTGVDYHHPDLMDNIFVNPAEIAGNGMDDDGNGYIDDIYGINAIIGNGAPMDDVGHGTHVSGIIAARGSNNTGVVGVIWEAQILGCKAFDRSGGTLANILTCMQYFLDLKNRVDYPIDIVATNNSWGGPEFSQALHDAILAHQQAGMLFVASAGGNSSDNDIVAAYPSGYDLSNIISVMATDGDDDMAEFTNVGARSVDVGAPGVDILSTMVGGGYQEFSGTSMAAAYVTGLAGLLKAQDPSRSAQAIKNLILTGGDVRIGTEGTTLSGRRINAHGSLSCTHQSLVNRYAPAGTSVVASTYMPMELGLLDIQCEQAGVGPHAVTVLETGETIALGDLGGMGQFTGIFTPPAPGTYTLTFSTGDVVTVSAIDNYYPASEVPLYYRTFTGTQLLLDDDESVAVDLPFAIPFGNEAGLTTIHVNSNGMVSFTEPIDEYENPSLPTDLATTVIAPLWDDLDPSSGGGVFYEVLGDAPDREVVIEWRDVPHVDGEGGVTFQIVFFENSANLLFGYADVNFGDPNLDNGASATVGLQINSSLAQQFSMDMPSLHDGMALVWSMGVPYAAAGPDQTVLPGVVVTLDGSGSLDVDGTITSYAWTQIAGTPVALSGADTPVATFTAPTTVEMLSFSFEVTDDQGNVGRDIVHVVANTPPVADAGANQIVAPGATVMLDGTASMDADGPIAGYSWTVDMCMTVSGPCELQIEGADTPTPSFIAPAEFALIRITLTVTDSAGSTATSSVVVSVFEQSPRPGLLNLLTW